MANSPGTPISNYARTIVARIAAAVDGKIETNSSVRGEYEAIAFVTSRGGFTVGIDKSVRSGMHSNAVTLAFLSNGIREESERYGRCEESAAGDLIPEAIEYRANDILPSFKSLVAREMDRSGVPELRALSADFVAELKGEKPEPPLSAKAQAALIQLNT